MKKVGNIKKNYYEKLVWFIDIISCKRA